VDTLQLIASIAGVVVAFIVGVLAEPAKLYFENRHKKQQLRIMLYKEMASNYFNLYSSATFIKAAVAKGTLNPMVSSTLERMKELNFDCYNYAKTQLTLFYQLNEAVWIDRVYKEFKNISVKLETLEVTDISPIDFSLDALEFSLILEDKARRKLIVKQIPNNQNDLLLIKANFDLEMAELDRANGVANRSMKANFHATRATRMADIQKARLASNKRTVAKLLRGLLSKASSSKKETKEPR
jgi:hypothetical protein